MLNIGHSAECIVHRKTMAAQYTSYRNLIVYQKAKGLTVDLINYFSKNRVYKSYEFLINQLFRSVSSIGANIAEGYGRHYTQSFRQFLSIARGSSFETDYWLDIATETGLARSDILNDFSERNNELAKMLTTMMKRTERSKN